MGEEEESYVGSRTAGTATYDRLIEASVGKLLDRAAASNQGLERIRVAFLGLENKSSEPLGSFHDQIVELVTTSVNTSDRFRMISPRFVDAGLTEVRLRRDELFIPRHQRAFAEALEKQGHPIEAMLFAKLTSGTTRGDGVRQVDYMLTMEMVDIQSGEFIQESKRIPKAYVR